MPKANPLFTRIRQSCAEVAANARWVGINRGALDGYLDRIAPQLAPMTHTAEHHLLDAQEETLIYFLILDAVNFGSGYFPYLDWGDDRPGYFTIAKRLKEHCLAEGIPGPADLARLEPSDCARIFRHDISNPHAAELMQLFALALNQLGEWVRDRHGGDCLGLLRHSASAEQAVSSLLEMPVFRDSATYGRCEVLFLKRAQITLHDMKVAAPDHPLLQFDDFAELTVFADNIVPFVLKADGILRYHGWLERRIQNREPIGAGSLEEIELRACALHAAELLRQSAGGSRAGMTAREVDHLLWNRGQALKTRVTDLPHVTRSVYY